MNFTTKWWLILFCVFSNLSLISEKYKIKFFQRRCGKRRQKNCGEFSPSVFLPPITLVRTSSTCSDYFALQKISRPFRCSSSPQKVTLGSAVRLQAHSQRFALATNFLRLLCVFSMFVEWERKTESFRPPFSKGGGFLRRSLKSPSAEGEIS